MNSIKINGCIIQLIMGDIVQIEERVGAVVNAANSSLAGGGGVDGALHRAAGPELMQETDEKYPDGCPTGSAVPTSAYGLNADFVFHAVGPIWNGGNDGEARLLASCYSTCLKLALDNSVDRIRFPSLSTGAYRYPLKSAAAIALSTVRDFLMDHGRPSHVEFVLFNTEITNAYVEALAGLKDK